MKNSFLKNKVNTYIVLLVVFNLLNLAEAKSSADTSLTSRFSVWVGSNKGLASFIFTAAGVGVAGTVGVAGKKIYDHYQNKSLAEEISDQKNQENTAETNNLDNDSRANEPATPESEAAPAMNEPESEVKKSNAEDVAPKSNNTQENKQQKKNPTQEESVDSNASPALMKKNPKPVIDESMLNDKSEESTNHNKLTEVTTGDSTDNASNEEDDNNPFIPPNDSFSDKWGGKFKSAASIVRAKTGAMGSSIKDRLSSSYQSGKTKIKNTAIYKDIKANRNPEQNLDGMLNQVKKGLDEPQIAEPKHKLESFEEILDDSRTGKKKLKNTRAYKALTGAYQSLTGAYKDFQGSRHPEQNLDGMLIQAKNNLDQSKAADQKAKAEVQEKQLDNFEKKLAESKKSETETPSKIVKALDLGGVKTVKSKNTALNFKHLDLDEGSFSRLKRNVPIPEIEAKK